MKNVRKLAVRTAISAPVSYLLWVVFVGTFSPHELEIGVVAMLLAMSGLIVLNLRYPARFSPGVTDLLAAWRIPWYLLSGTWEVVYVAARDLVGGKRAQSLFRSARFDTGELEDPHDTARRVLAALYTTIAPNFIVLGVNVSDRKLLFHQIERSSVPQMTKTLGACG